MSAIERGLYVAVGAADLAVEKVQQLPVVKNFIELRERSIIDQARELEPKLRRQAKELAARGEKVVERVRTDAAQFGKQVRDFPAEAGKQLREFPETARKQVTDFRGRFVRNGGNGKPAPKTSAKANTKATATVS